MEMSGLPYYASHKLFKKILSSSLGAVKYSFLTFLCLGEFLFRFTEKGNLEVLLFTIQSKMRANNQKVYMPREGKLISDINKVYPGFSTPHVHLGHLFSFNLTPNK